jgi:hypothetical protein
LGCPGENDEKSGTGDVGLGLSMAQVGEDGDARNGAGEEEDKDAVGKKDDDGAMPDSGCSVEDENVNVVEQSLLEWLAPSSNMPLISVTSASRASRSDQGRVELLQVPMQGKIINGARVTGRCR